MRLTGRSTWVFCLCVVFVSSTFSNAQQPVALQKEQPSASGGKFTLDDATPVKLRLNRNLSSADAKTGDTIDFEVLEEVKVEEIVVIPKGSLAIGTVTDAEHKRRMARGGKLDIEIDYVKLGDGEKATLRAVKETKGGGHTGAMTGGIVAAAIVVWPAAPFFLFMHGKDTTIPKGTEITAYVNGAMPLQEAKFATPATLPPDGSTSAAPTQHDQQNSATLEITSNPSGGEISVDGNFVGDTPSELGVAAGVHTITISKHTYKVWERKLTVSAGKVTVSADLEQ